MSCRRVLYVLLAVVLLSGVLLAAEESASKEPVSSPGVSADPGWQYLALLADSPEAASAETAAPTDTASSTDESSETKSAPTKGPPLPITTIEGVSGGAITPLAYLCNSGQGALPSLSYTYLDLGSKEMHTLAVTQTFFNRVEIGYACNFLNLGSLDDDITGATGLPVRDHIRLHHFNLRGLLIEEDSFDLPLPAVTAGVHFKYNDGISQINSQLGGALRGIGYDQSHGVDYTLTFTKMFPELAFGRPLILTAGLRNSKAAQIGLLGFGEHREWTVEGSAVCLPLDNLAVSYEFRQKANPYTILDDLIDREQNWHAFAAHWIVTDRLTVSAVYGMLGNIANARADSALGLQIKYEF